MEQLGVSCSPPKETSAHASVDSDQLQQQCCVLDYVKEANFGRMAYHLKADILSKGRPTPDLNLSTKTKSYIRHFKHDYYNSHKWLTACKTENKLYCWPCVLFCGEKGVWNTYGFTDINNFHKATSRHEKTQAHLYSITKLKTFGASRIDLQLNSQKKAEIVKYNSQVAKNRELMKRLIDVTCFLANQELSFRGHDESAESLNRGNYIEIIHFLGKYDVKLSNHLETSTVFKGASNRIQNDLIYAISDVLQNKIKDEINDANFISIMLDETTDVAKLSQLSTVLRYVKEGEIEERFIGFTDVSSDRSARALCEHVTKILSGFNCTHKLVGQSYDGAATFAGSLNGLQSLVKKMCNPNALFVHCHAHRLNLVLSQSVGFIKECKIFFKTLSGLSAFFSHSTKRVNALEQSEVRKRFPSVSTTRWNYNSRIVNTVYENKQELGNFFEHIIEESDNWDDSTFLSARGFLTSLKDFNFQFLLEVFMCIFPLTDTLFNVLQSKTLDVKYCVEKIQETVCQINTLRQNFDTIYSKVSDILEEPPKRRRGNTFTDVKTSYVQLFNEIIDTIVQQIDVRFHDVRQLHFLELVDSKKFENFKTEFPEEAFQCLKETYMGIFNFENLRSELTAAYRLSDFTNKTVSETVYFLKNTGLFEEGFPEMYKLCTLICTIPVSTASVERSFSAIKRIKTYVRNTQSEIRLSSLSILSVEKKLLKEIQQKDFYDTVLENFVKRGNRRIPLTYK